MAELQQEGKNKIGDTVVKGAIKHGSEADLAQMEQQANANQPPAQTA